MSGLRGPSRLTRRAALRGAAVAGTAALVRPAAGLGLDGAASARVFSVRVGRLAGGETAPIAVPQAFSLIGLEWSRPPGVRIELRARAATGVWSRWVSASVRGHGPDRGPHVTARSYQMRCGVPGGYSPSFGERQGSRSRRSISSPSSAMAIRTWARLSRSRRVTVRSSSDWWSTVTAHGVPISSWRR